LNIVRTDIEEALRILDDAFATIEPHRPA